MFFISYKQIYFIKLLFGSLDYFLYLCNLIIKLLDMIYRMDEFVREILGEKKVNSIDHTITLCQFFTHPD